MAQDVSYGLTASRDAGRVELLPGWSTATMGKARGPQGTPSPWEQDVPHTARGSVAVVAAGGATGVRAQGLTTGQLTIGVGQSIATWGREERRGERGVSTWLLLALSPLPHGVGPLCRGCAAPAPGAPSMVTVNPPGYKPLRWSWARRCCSPSPWKQGLKEPPPLSPGRGLWRLKLVLQEPPMTPLQLVVPREPRGESCTQLAAPRPAPKQRF